MFQLKVVEEGVGAAVRVDGRRRRWMRSTRSGRFRKLMARHVH
jgi:hypothetical protein